MNKKGLELTINFLVMLIITITIFAFGIKFGYDIMNKSTTLADQVDKDTSAKLESALSTGSKIAMPESSKKLKVGESYLLPVGIYNILDQQQSFSIAIAPYTCFKSEKELCDFAFTADGWSLPPRVQSIAPNEKKVIGLPIKIPKDARKATYVFNVYVCYDSTCDASSSKKYDDAHQLMLVVN